MLFSVEQAFVGREEIRAPLKMPAGEAISYADVSLCGRVAYPPPASLSFY